jgi:hypothetical protein
MIHWINGWLIESRKDEHFISSHILFESVCSRNALLFAKIKQRAFHPSLLLVNCVYGERISFKVTPEILQPIWM